MTRRNLAFILVALAVSLPLAVAVIAHSDQPVVVQPLEPVAQIAAVITDEPEGAACAATTEPPLVGGCGPEVCQITCPNGSCSIGDCDPGYFPKCVCRPGGNPMCGCVLCP